MNKNNIVILHGTFSNPNSNWFPWLKKELVLLNQNVIVPKFPTPQNQTIEKWIEILDKNVKKYNDSLILIGHSSAPLVICAKLQQLDKPIKASFLVAPFLGKIGNDVYDKANSNFVNYPFNWNKIKKMSKFFIYRSDNDSYVPEKFGKIVADNLKVKEITVPDGKHLNGEAGFNDFPKLLKDIKKIL